MFQTGTLTPMSDKHVPTFANQILVWRGKKSVKEAAAILDLDYPTMRKYACGKRTPAKLVVEAILTRMEKRRDATL